MNDEPRNEWADGDPQESREYAPPPQPLSFSRIEFERVFGGRVLAWIGGLATLLGLVFLMRSAVDSSWFTEEVRTLMAAFGSLALLVLGVWLHEKKGHLEAARVAVAVAIPGLYATTVVATQTYDLISPVLGLEAGALIGVIGVAIAVRWSSMLVGSVGILGALAAPMLVGTMDEGGSIAFVALALAAGVGVLLWQRWNWLALGAFAVSAPQLVSWLYESGFITFEGEASPSEPVLLVLAVLVGFWALYAAAAFGYELRSQSEEKLPVSSWLLLLCSSVFVVGAGCTVIGGDSALALNAWIFGFAAVHLLLGGAAIRFGIHREIGSLLTGGGIALGSIGLANAFDGPTLVAVWSAMAAALAYMATRVDRGHAPTLSDAQRLLLVAFGFLALAIVHTLVVEAPPNAIVEGVADLGSSLVAARRPRRRRRPVHGPGRRRPAGQVLPAHPGPRRPRRAGGAARTAGRARGVVRAAVGARRVAGRAAARDRHAPVRGAALRRLAARPYAGGAHQRRGLPHVAVRQGRRGGARAAQAGRPGRADAVRDGARGRGDAAGDGAGARPGRPGAGAAGRPGRRTS